MKGWQLGLVLAAALGIVAVLVVRSGDGPGTPVGEPLLPDLWSSAPFELTIDSVDGRPVIRFTSEINNGGSGDLIVRGNVESNEFTQWIPHSQSGHSVATIEVEAVWGGDTHDHWHLDDIAQYWIEPMRGQFGETSYDNKVGFCMFDSVNRFEGLPGAPDQVRYEIDGCGGRLLNEVAMGLSVGWGDKYRYNLYGQWIFIDDLPAGDYRLLAEVDPDGLLVESKRNNNLAWTDFRLEVAPSGERTVTEIR